MEFFTFWIIKIISAIIVLITAILLYFVAIKKIKNEKNKKIIIEDKFANYFVSQFNDAEISESITGYIQPDYSPTDPSNKDGEDYIPDTRENLFSYLDRQISESSKTFNLILADTGMGKTAFCLNYFSHLKNNKSEYRICIISMSQGDAINRIKK